jgi:Holliday junction resolvase-like predicted endonuclease
MTAIPGGGLGKLTKAEQLAVNVEKGAQAEKAVEGALKAEGREILGKQVGVRTEQGLRKVDILTKDTGKLTNVEVKSGDSYGYPSC